MPVPDAVFVVAGPLPQAASASVTTAVAAMREPRAEILIGPVLPRRVIRRSFGW
jgi:hypothetical protein